MRPDAITADRGRGQLMLVGAAALAVVILGLVVVLNAALYTENVAPQNGYESAGSAEGMLSTVRGDIARLMATVRNEDGRIPESWLRANLTDYERLMGASSVRSTGTRLAVSLNATTSTTTTAVIQPDREKLTDKSGNEDFRLVDAGRVTELTMVFAAGEVPVPSGSGPNGLSLRVDDGSDSWEIRFERQPSGRDPDIDVTVDASNGTDQSFTVDGSGTVTLTLTEVSTDDGTVESIDFAEGVTVPYALDVAGGTSGDGQAAEANYSVLVDGTVPDTVAWENRTACGAPPCEPYARSFVTSAALDVTVETGSLSYESTVTGVTPDATGLATGGGGSLAGPTFTRLLDSDFEEDDLGDTPWVEFSDGDYDGVSIIDAVSFDGDRAAELRGDETGGGIETVGDLNTSGADAVTVELWAKAGYEGVDPPESDPPAGEPPEDLLVEYLDADGSWVEAGRIDDWADEEEFRLNVTITASAAMHEGFRLRIGQEDTTYTDIWVVDDIVVTRRDDP